MLGPSIIYTEKYEWDKLVPDYWHSNKNNYELKI